MKKSFALRVDVEVYEAIEKWAADEFRSTNGQIEWILSDEGQYIIEATGYIGVG